ncbi:YceI family protein [Gaoshiqia sp. Z1-71]|uniref:YceI family protein n=1 Tax=Gaoshiqia hydrogeniformans TaxID=3290090 RepID=UPI003BF83E34
MMKTIKLLIIALGVVLTGTVNAQVLKANTSKSEVTWLGKKVTGQHNGTINLKSGELNVDGSSIAGGEFIIDMKSIKNLDITDSETNQKLVGHLKSDDFFSVETYPEAKLVIKEKAMFSGNSAKVTGDLTIKGITNPVTFDVTRDGNVYTSDITVDRSKYNVRYGSGSFFSNLGNNLIYDEFVIGVKLAVE